MDYTDMMNKWAATKNLYTKDEMDKAFYMYAKRKKNDLIIIEEFSELIQVLSKRVRGIYTSDNTHDQMVTLEEMADVWMMIEIYLRQHDYLKYRKLDPELSINTLMLEDIKYSVHHTELSLIHDLSTCAGLLSGFIVNEGATHDRFGLTSFFGDIQRMITILRFHYGISDDYFYRMITLKINRDIERNHISIT